MILHLNPQSILLTLFGAPKIPLNSLYRIQENSPNIIIWAAPIMFFFVLIEWYFASKEHKKLYDRKDTIGSISVGVGNVIINFFLKVTFLYLAIWIYDLIPWRFHLVWWTLIPCYVIFDFCSYWAHRFSHTERFLWATHVVHHSSEQYNLTVSFRLSWVQDIKIIFFLPVALIGFHPVIIFVTSQVAVLFQFWVHTEYIRKLHPIMEYIFATPSNHRVHHGSQDKYINKNYGATFIFWDRMFGTYQKEVERAVYGITSEVGSKTNPITLNFHEYRDMWNDVKSTKSLRRKLFYIFGNPTSIARLKKSLLAKEMSEVVSELSVFDERDSQLVAQ